MTKVALSSAAGSQVQLSDLLRPMILPPIKAVRDDLVDSTWLWQGSRAVYVVS